VKEMWTAGDKYSWRKMSDDKVFLKKSCQCLSTRDSTTPLSMETSSLCSVFD